MTDTKQYLERLGDLVAGKDPLAIQETTASAIAALIQSESEGRLQVRPAPNKWSVVEIIAHLADDELVASWRFRQMLERPGCTLPGFDQDKWAVYGCYGEWNSQEAVGLFRLLRNTNLRMLRSLNAEDWMCYGEHAERGRITVHSLATHMAGHDLNHLEQIRFLLTEGIGVCGE